MLQTHEYHQIDRLIPKNMEAFREKMAHTPKSEYPEMLRELTAFVQGQMRQIPGVISTKTLIPGRSMIKAHEVAEA